MKTIVGLLLLLYSLPSYALHISIPSKNLDLDTKKVAHISGEINKKSLDVFIGEMIQTKEIPGDRIIIIKSPGGDVSNGESMLRIIRLEQSKGIKVVCVANDYADSMAFNILSNCDVRLATVGTTMLVHKIFIEKLPFKGTARNLRIIAKDLDMTEFPYKVKNASLMGLTFEEYDYYADEETTWSAKTLLNRGYLFGILNENK